MTSVQIIASSIPGSFILHAEGPSSQIGKAHRVLQGEGAMAAENPSKGEDASKAVGERSGPSPAEVAEDPGERPTSGTEAKLHHTESSETVVHSPSSKPKGKGQETSQENRPDGPQGILFGHLKDDESGSNLGGRPGTISPSGLTPMDDFALENSVRESLPHGPKFGSLGSQGAPPRIVIQPATDATGLISPLPTPAHTSDPEEAERGRPKRRRGSTPQNPFNLVGDVPYGYFPDTTKASAIATTKSVNDLTSILPFPDPDVDMMAMNTATPAPRLFVKEKRRTHALRKGRYLVLRSPVLRAMLGREIAGTTKPALATLAHRTPKKDYPPLAPSLSLSRPRP